MPLAYFCRGCDNLSKHGQPRKWFGPCPFCGGRWSIVSRNVSSEECPDGERTYIEDGEAVSLCDVDDVKEEKRIVIGGPFSSVDYVLGGETAPGIMPGSVTLLAGTPGRGKSTLTLQILQQLAKSMTVLYVVGEESIKQVKFRSKRFGEFHPRLKIVRETQLDNILDHIDDIRPKVVVIDSTQTIECISPITDEDLEAGSTSAIRTAVKILCDYAQAENVAIILVGHVTADGSIAGPHSGLHHAVDVLLYFSGQENDSLRILKCDSKNRFGPAGPHVFARFDMTEKGLISLKS